MIFSGSVLAAVLIVFGLYLILWGKAKETKKINQLAPLESCQELPISMTEANTRSPPINTICSQQENKLAN